MTRQTPRRVTRNRAVARLTSYFHRNGYVRGRGSARDRADGVSHRGYELRLSALDEAELEEIQALLRIVDIRPGKAFRKGPSFRVPVYGRDQVDRLLQLVGGTRKRGLRPRSASGARVTRA